MMRRPPTLHWEAVEEMVDGILARRIYTNHGPLAQALEHAAADRHGARHAIAVTNPVIGLTMMLEAAGAPGTILVSALAPRRCLQAISCTGATPEFCDVDDLFHWRSRPTAAHGRPGGAILLAPEYDGSDAAFAASAAACGLVCIVDGTTLPRAHPALAILPGLRDGPSSACILADDDGFAARLRNIRSSYGAGPPVPVRRTANGRLSEVQAGLALLQSINPVRPCFDALPPQLNGRPNRRFGPAMAVIMDGAAEREAALAALLSEGHPAYRPSALPEGARSCRNAADFAARAILLKTATPTDSRPRSAFQAPAMAG